MSRVLTPEVVQEYESLMKQKDLLPGTIQKYLLDIRKLEDYLLGGELTQDKLDHYPQWLLEEKKYKKHSVNTIVVSTRVFCHTMGWDDLHVNGYSLNREERKKQDKYVSRAEYQKLVTTAFGREDYRMAMLIQTLCHMDIRYSELEKLDCAALREGAVTLTRRDQTFSLEIPEELRTSLRSYVEKLGIVSGPVFCSTSGKPLDRSNIWREVKMLCLRAGLDDERISIQKLKMPQVKDYYPFYPMPV